MFFVSSVLTIHYHLTTSRQGSLSGDLCKKIRADQSGRVYFKDRICLLDCFEMSLHKMERSYSSHKMANNTTLSEQIQNAIEKKQNRYP